MRETPRQEANLYRLHWRSGDKLSCCDCLPCCHSLHSSLHEAHRMNETMMKVSCKKHLYIMIDAWVHVIKKPQKKGSDYNTT